MPWSWSAFVGAIVGALGGALVGVLLFGSIGKGASPSGTPAEMKDSEVRKYIEGPLKLYLDSLVYQVCAIKVATAPTAPGRLICPPGPPDGYKPPPGDGAP